MACMKSSLLPMINSSLNSDLFTNIRIPRLIIKPGEDLCVQKILVSGFFRQSSIYLTTKQIHFPKIVKIGSIIVNDHVHAIEPGFRRAFACGYGGTPSVHVTPALSAHTGPSFGAIQAKTARNACTGPRFGPVQAPSFWICGEMWVSSH